MKTRTLFVSLLAAAACLVAQSAKAQTLYANGVTGGLTLSQLEAQGWTLDFSQPFDSGPITQSTISGWAAAAGSGYVFVGAINSDGTVLLGATGLASQVLQETNSTSEGTLYSSSNLYWYNNPSPLGSGDPVGSFGFAPTQDINLFEADITNDGPANDAYRLSWHTNYDGGGYRVGDSIFPGGDTKIVLVAPSLQSNVPDASSTLLLVGAGLTALVAIRSRKPALG